MIFPPSDVVDTAIKHKKNMIALCQQEDIKITSDVSKALDLASETYAYQYLLRKEYQRLFTETIQQLNKIVKGD
jgi:hypothetical protein